MSIKDIEKILMNPSKVPLSEIRQLKRELVELRKIERANQRKKIKQLSLETLRK